MNFFLLDDNTDFLNQFKDFIIKFSIKQNLDINLTCYDEIPDDYETKYDAFFLDVEIKNNTSFAFAENIKEKYPSTPIIFLSNYDMYINHSVKLYIFDFIRKSHFDDEIEDTLMRLIKYIDKNEKKIIIKSNLSHTKININEIIYIEAFSHNCILHLNNNNNYSVNKGVSDVLNQYISFFTRVHKSYFVNMSYVKSISSNEIIFLNDLKIPIGKKYKDNTYKDFLNYIKKSSTTIFENIFQR